MFFSSSKQQETQYENILLTMPRAVEQGPVKTRAHLRADSLVDSYPLFSKVDDKAQDTGYALIDESSPYIHSFCPMHLFLRAVISWG